MCKNNHTTRCPPKVQHPGRGDLDQKSAQAWCNLHPMGCISEREEADWNNNQLCTPNHWTLWPMENLKLYSIFILVATNIEAFCRLCRKCQTNKTDTQKPQGFLHSLPIPDKLWQSVGMDFMGPLPQSQGNDYLLVIIDWLMLQVHLVPTTMWVTAKEVAWLFLKEIVRLHGVPESIVSDCNTKFMSTFWCELHKLMGTKLLMSTAFHPQMDGATEQANHSIGQILRMIIHDDQRDWAAKCPMVEFALNSNVSATTRFAPFKLNQRYMPQIGMPTLFDTTFKDVKQFGLQVK